MYTWSPVRLFLFFMTFIVILMNKILEICIGTKDYAKVEEQLRQIESFILKGIKDKREQFKPKSMTSVTYNLADNPKLYSHLCLILTFYVISEHRSPQNAKQRAMDQKFVSVFSFGYNTRDVSPRKL